MNTALLFPLFLYCITTSFTPGPNNLMLMTSGVNFGYRRTLPHIMGVNLGFPFMVFLVGLGLGQIFILYPILGEVLRYGGAAYLLWLAWKIAHAGAVEDGKEVGKPFGFFPAAAFQWVNPKAWIMALGANATFPMAADPLWSSAIIAGMYCAIGVPISSIWVVFGVGLRQYLADPRNLRIFNWTMAGLLVLTLVWIFWESSGA